VEESARERDREIRPVEMRCEGDVGTDFDHVDALEELSRDDRINYVLRFRYTDEIRWLTSMIAIPQYYATRDETLISLPTSPAY